MRSSGLGFIEKHYYMCECVVRMLCILKYDGLGSCPRATFTKTKISILDIN